MLADYSHLIGGMSGGIASTLICHPLDLLRIRYAGKVYQIWLYTHILVNEGQQYSIRPQYRSYWHALRTIFKSEGIRGIYQGLTPTVIAAPLG
jgi:solute carrier family 25 folate transporter 32